MVAPNKETTFPQQALKLTKVEFPPPEQTLSSLGIFTTALTHVGERITPWGIDQAVRDWQLRRFWLTEPYLAGAIYSVCIRNAAFEWEVEGPDRLSFALTDMLNSSISGEAFGWIPFITSFSQDYYTQDNGSFIELIRDPTIDAGSKFKNEKAPTIGLAHLDSGQCQRTGNPKTPILYTDRKGKVHKMKWFQVIPVSEFRSAIETMNGVGYSAITRLLKMAQIMSSIETYKDEKVSGRQYRALHLVSGVGKTEIEDVMVRGQEEADNKGQIAFVLPAILASLDPEKPVTHVQIDLASLPDGFDIDAEMKWYISAQALCLGVDYQDLAPLPTGNIGSAEQSEILHRKSKGKGPAHFMETIQNVFRDYGVIPRPAKFKFKIKDLAEEMEQAAMRTKMAEEFAIHTRAGIITPKEVREILVKRGVFDADDLPPVDDEFGMEILKPGSLQMRGSTGDNTMAEDVRRTKKESDEVSILKSLYGISKSRKDREKIQNDTIKELGDVVKLLKKRKEEPPVVNVTVPALDPPVIDIQPEIVVQAPDVKVNVEAPEVKEQKFPKIPKPEVKVNVEVPTKETEIVEVVERDADGRVKKVKKTRK
jgi:hypothetical protein